jgi:hypothetical protein
MLGVLVDTSQTPRPANPASRILGRLRALGKGVAQPHCHRSSVSSDRLQLSCFKLGVRGLLVWHIQQADLELAQKHDSLSGSSAVLGIR